jgi:hypothetical protein
MSALIKLAGVALCTNLAAAPVHAHHSFGQFDDKQCVTIEGSIKKFQFSYPHTWLWVVEQGADGVEVLWGFEGADPATLSLYGWSQDFMKKGDKVTVAFNPLRDGRKGGSMRKIMLPNGKLVSAQGDESVFAKCELSKSSAVK